ncbi:MAG: LpxL/LpxP family Kdo(2)-lipid IV(A) lauroyl/palmitoleoyl acyltransferase [Moritella sp.]|uniref:LpxL/LpxP family Kdo(2)-lipid IV(A) lauroyl/palmitoleoyl acyltransferase n=1 Tax=Moritella sp. TaxID=78556 RepID=UPI0029A38C53|nr:LpxL/LpxP family Kdo(2)-lipid IV(A) lauroyl/palmitoleoyl acyltransferase [Moritella sp.]MDX2321145.1 LpxL/LpxP family Kdo(2)-lipid IV(A) lauroyl/palmitoleoyl acyltransferase [Moritella sp.]
MKNNSNTDKPMVTKDNTKFKFSFLHPKNWPLLFAATLLWFISLLPNAVQTVLGRALGRLVMKILPSRLKIAQQNLALSFPDKSDTEIKALAKENFEYTGLAVIDTANAWFWPDWRIKKNMVIKGQEHIDQAKADGNGMLILGAHFLSLEISARIFGLLRPAHAIYRPNKSPLMEYLQCRGRTLSNKGLFDRRDIKGMLRILAEGEPLWYAPDHDYGRRRSVFVPFFAVEKACTITATTLFASGANTKTYPVSSCRLPDGRYQLIIRAPLENFPTGDEVEDAKRCNQECEKSILEQVPQYMWLHRRFKTRPEGEPSLYK